MDFSVIVPTRNRPAALRRCLEALAGQTWAAGQWEVIIVDDGGEPDLQPLLAGYAARMRVHLLRVPHGGPGPARNAGARAAQGRWLAFTDDDCEPEPGWLSALAPRLAGRVGVMAGGTTVNGLKDNPRAEASQLIAAAAYAYFNANPDQARFFASNNLACERAAFLHLGGFDERFRVASEDRELVDRWVSRGYPAVRVPDARVRHCHDLTLKKFLRQHFSYGRGAARFHQLRREQGRGRLLSDVSFRWSLGSLLLAPALRTRFPLRVLALLGLWQAANTAGFLYEHWRISREATS